MQVKTQTVEIFIAADGQRFLTESEMRRYSNNSAAMLLSDLLCDYFVHKDMHAEAIKGVAKDMLLADKKRAKLREIINIIGMTDDIVGMDIIEKVSNK